jgi:hypothetical protein
MPLYEIVVQQKTGHQYKKTYEIDAATPQEAEEKARRLAGLDNQFKYVPFTVLTKEGEELDPLRDRQVMPKDAFLDVSDETEAEKKERRNFSAEGFGKVLGKGMFLNKQDIPVPSLDKGETPEQYAFDNAGFGATAEGAGGGMAGAGAGDKPLSFEEWLPEVSAWTGVGQESDEYRALINAETLAESMAEIDRKAKARAAKIAEDQVRSQVGPLTGDPSGRFAYESIDPLTVRGQAPLRQDLAVQEQLAPDAGFMAGLRSALGEQAGIADVGPMRDFLRRRQSPLMNAFYATQLGNLLAGGGTGADADALAGQIADPEVTPAGFGQFVRQNVLDPSHVYGRAGDVLRSLANFTGGSTGTIPGSQWASTAAGQLVNPGSLEQAQIVGDMAQAAMMNQYSPLVHRQLAGAGLIPGGQPGRGIEDIYTDYLGRGDEVPSNFAQFVQQRFGLR